MISKVRNDVFGASWVIACLGCALFGLLSLQSCKKEYFEQDRIKDATWNPELAVPLIQSKITIPEVLSRLGQQEIIVIDTTGILALKYRSNIFSVSADSLIVFQDQVNTQSYSLLPTDETTLSGGGTVTVPTQSFNMGFDVSNLGTNPELSSIEFQGGDLILDVSKQFTYPTTVQIQIPGLTMGGVGFTQTINGASQMTIPLAGRILNFTAVNQIPVTVDLSIQGSSGSGTAGQSITFTTSITGMKFRTIVGDLKQQPIPSYAGVVAIKFFENDISNSGVVRWADPRVKAIFTNGSGADLQLNVSHLDFYSSSTRLALTSSLSPPNQPTLLHDATPGVSKATAFDINRTNSNLIDVADKRPTSLDYEFSAMMNPGSGPNVNWLRDTSRLRLDMEVFLPFDGTAKDFRRSDTTAVDIFPLNGDIEEIESVTIRMTMDNGFPADAFGQVYFYDSTLSPTNPGVLIDSLFEGGRVPLFQSPVVPGYPNHVDQTQKKRTVVDIVIDRTKLKKLEAQGFRKLVARGWVDTYQMGLYNVQVFSDYTIDLYLGMMVKAKVKVAF
ncbi:MAG: hypothetical protein RLZZ165_312 [Bacteroidota bacterium]|jgi:hypothetical protein